jgi:epoxyqueuosine reductase
MLSAVTVSFGLFVPSMEAHDHLTGRIRTAALGLGFTRVGFASAEPFETARPRLAAWLAAGHAGGMDYLAGPDDRTDPRALAPHAKTLLSVALPYERTSVALRRRRDDPRALLGTVARYAVGDDYHRVLKDKLLALEKACDELVGRPVVLRAAVDSAPLLEREAAARAGIGFTGKSTMTIAPGLGTYFLLGELLLDVELEASKDPEAGLSGCGRCTACLDACPTRAFVGPYVLDARRCISYLTIESKDAMPRELRPLIGTRVFGCDVCQDVCPFNASEAVRPAAPELAARPSLDAPELVSWLTLGAAGYRKLVKRSALRRVGKAQLQRNAAVALGNSGDVRAVAPLARALEADPSALVRAHAAWALGALGPNISGVIGRDALTRASEHDPDETVREESRLALASLDGSTL